MPGGRPPGTANKLRQQQLDALERRLGPEFQPLAIMAEQSMKLLEEADLKDDNYLRVQGIASLEKVTKYLMPTIKAMEVDVTNSDGSFQRPTQVRLIPVPVNEAGKVLDKREPITINQGENDGEERETAAAGTGGPDSTTDSGQGAATASKWKTGTKQ